MNIVRQVPSCALAFLLILPCALRAQETTDIASDTARINAEIENLKAQLAKLQAKNALQAELNAEATAQTAADKSAKDAKQQAQIATINALAELGGKLPAGSLTVSSDGIGTPKGMQLGFENLNTAAQTVAEMIGDRVHNKTLILVDAIPAPNVGSEKILYEKLMKDIIKEANTLLGKDGAQAQGVPAAVLIAAIPGIVNAIGGFFRSDITEKTAEAKISSSTAGTALLAELEKGSKKPKEVFFSLEAYAFSNLANLSSSPVVIDLAKIKELDDELAAEAKGVSTRPQEKAVNLTSAEVAEIKEAIKNLEVRRDLLAELIKIAPSNGAGYEQQIAQIGQQLATQQKELVLKNGALDEAKAALTLAGAKRETISSLRERIAKLMAAMSSTEGAPPLFVRLVRDSLIGTPASLKDTVRYVALSVPSSVQSSITKKNLFYQTHLGSSLLALEYRVADGASGLIVAGIVPQYQVQKLTVNPPKAPAKK